MTSYVEPFPLGQADQRQLVAEEVGRAHAGAVGPVEGRHPRAVGVVNGTTWPPVEVAAAPVVVGLPGGDGVHEHQRRARGRVCHRERDIALRAGGCDQFQQVRAGWPARADTDPERRLPAGLGHVGDGIGHRTGLAPAGEAARAPHQPAAPPPVPAHAVGLDPEPARFGGHVQTHGLTRAGAGVVGIALDRMRRAQLADAPGGRARPLVLGGDPASRVRRRAAGTAERRPRPARQATEHPARQAGTASGDEAGCDQPERVEKRHGHHDPPKRAAHVPGHATSPSQAGRSLPAKARVV